MFYHVCRRHQSDRFSIIFFFSIAFLLLIYFSFDLLFHLEWMYKREFSGVICRFQILCSLQRQFQKNKTFFITVKIYIYIYIYPHTFWLNTEIKLSLKLTRSWQCIEAHSSFPRRLSCVCDIILASCRWLLTLLSVINGGAVLPYILMFEL